jgi:hypothetical protein
MNISEREPLRCADGVGDEQAEDEGPEGVAEAPCVKGLLPRDDEGEDRDEEDDQVAAEEALPVRLHDGDAHGEQDSEPEAQQGDANVLS